MPVSPRFKRNLNLTVQEEDALKENPEISSPKASDAQFDRELKNFKSCLNSTIVWNSQTRHPVDVSITLLNMIT
jgi:hypothetical protein